MTLRPVLRLGLVLVFSFLLALPGWASHPNHPQGFDPERSYQTGANDLDQVDLFSGRLSMTIPIGPFTLVYNNNPWRYNTTISGKSAITEAMPDRYATGGIGWHLGWGELYSPSHPWYNQTGKWLYISDDGGHHVFYNNMHRDTTDNDGNVFYTRDGSFLRLRVINNFNYDIEFPDGTVRRFAGNGPSSPYTLRKVWGPFSSVDDPDLTMTYNADDTQRTVTTRYGATHVVTLAKGGDMVDGHALSWTIRLVTKVDVQGVDGERAEYDFEYRNIVTKRSCKDNDPTTDNNIRLAHLVEIKLPDGTAFNMKDANNNPYYNTVCGGTNMEDLPGTLQQVQLPTGGFLRWTWQAYEFPPGDNWSPFNTAVGVATRELVESDGTTVHGTWRYKTTQMGASGGNDPEMRTQVVYPTGDCSKHYFDAIHWQDPNPVPKGWEYGLPFVYREESGGKYLSSELYTSNNGQGVCSGDKVQSTYLRFRHDAVPGTGSADPQEWYQSNRLVNGTRVVYHDLSGATEPVDRYIDTELSDYDGIGNFRTSVTTSNFWATTHLERRTRSTNYIAATGNYGQTGYTPPSPSDPWLLSLFDSRETAEDDAHGETMSRTEQVVDTTTGAVLCARALKSGTSRGVDDIVTTFDLDDLGLVTDVKLYGGDLQDLETDSICDNLPVEPEYWTQYTYSSGVMATRRPVQPDGTLGPFLTYDVTVDSATGRVLSSRDTSGYETTFSYDDVGRIDAVTPQDGAWTDYTYTNFDGTNAATVNVNRYDFDGTTSLMEYEVIIDDFGRQTHRRRKLPGDVWTERETTYNARGWITDVTEWGDSSLKTTFSGFDPLGRATTITPPDGAAHAILLDFEGLHKTTRTVKVQTSLDGAEEDVQKVSERDAYGRLRRVTEPSGAGGAMMGTVYSYDVGHRMTQVVSGHETTSSMQGLGSLGGFGTNTLQTRGYVYDNLGFLLSETHPEKGLAGNGSVTYDDFDTSGRYHQKTDGPNDLGYTYDFMGRLTVVRDLNTTNNRAVQSFVYDLSPGFGVGKVFTAARHNYLDLPWTSTTDDERVSVTKHYNYGGKGGAPSVLTTIYGWPDGASWFRERYFDDDLGDIEQHIYPRCVAGPCLGSGVDTARTVNQTFDEGLLTSVTDWIDDITYQTSGHWSTMVHSNGVTDHLTPHSSLRSKVGQVRTTGAVGYNYNSGSYAYDGAGNIKSMGGDTGDHFAYDGVGRLKTANFWNNYLEKRYEYDAFGNMTSEVTHDPDNDVTISTETFAVDSSTNRLNSGATYDGAGNLVQYGPHQFTYDTSNRLVSQAWMQYIYDAYGERAGAIPNAGGSSRIVYYHLRDLAHQLRSEILQSGTTYTRNEDTLYAGGRLIGSVKGSTERHFHTDHLGTPQLLTDATGTSLSEPFLLPFGEEYPFESTTTNRKLTGHERDFSTGTDYMHARQYMSDINRFMSVDPKRGSRGAPQSLNRYAYVLNNPVRYLDADGRETGAGASGNPCGNNPNCNMMREIADRSKPIVDAGNVAVQFYGLGGLGPMVGTKVRQTIAKEIATGLIKGEIDPDNIFGTGVWMGLMEKFNVPEWMQDHLQDYALALLEYLLDQSLSGDGTIFIDEVTVVDNKDKDGSGDGSTGDGGDGDDSGDDDDDDSGDDDDGCAEPPCRPERPEDPLRGVRGLDDLQAFRCILTPTVCYWRGTFYGAGLNGGLDPGRIIQAY